MKNMLFATLTALDLERGGSSVEGIRIMLTYEDCLAWRPLSEGEIAAIARHEHVPEMVALELGSALHETPEGMRQIQRLLRENPEDASRNEADIAEWTS